MSGTTDFSRKLDAIKPVPDNAYWVSLDVKSFYKSIPNAEEIKAVNESFDNHTSKHAATHLIFLAPILNVTNFVFNCKHYFQRKRMCYRSLGEKIYILFLSTRSFNLLTIH